jgi:toluene monooxygenase system ferredoxin subunit
MTYQALTTLPLFQGLASEEIDLLAGLFQREAYAAGTTIFAQGDAADRLYVLISGRVAIRFKPHDGEVLTISEVEEGNVFGWSAVLGRDAYTSCAVCTEDSQALSIHGDVLRRLCETHPETGVVILERLAGVIAERLRNTHTLVVELLREGIQTTGGN